MVAVMVKKRKSGLARATVKVVDGASVGASAEADVELKRRARAIFTKLEREYPEAGCSLRHVDAFELLVATILSAQCTDVRVNIVTPVLFGRYPTVEKMAKAKIGDVEKIIRSTGFFRNKAKSLVGSSRMIVDKYAGRVPDNMEELLELPGVARKTANVVLGNAYGVDEGVVVDTHVKRLSVRMGLSEGGGVDRIEVDLIGLFAKRNWTLLPHLMIFHGRAVCRARKVDCEGCCVAKECSKVGVEGGR